MLLVVCNSLVRSSHGILFGFGTFSACNLSSSCLKKIMNCLITSQKRRLIEFTVLYFITYYYVYVVTKSYKNIKIIRVVYCASTNLAYLFRFMMIPIGLLVQGVVKKNQITWCGFI